MIKQIQKDTKAAVSSMESGTTEVEKGKELALKAGNSLGNIIKGSNETVDVINQVASASEEQSKTAEEISSNIEAIRNVTHQSAQGTEQIAKDSEDMNRLMTNLSDLVNQFKLRGTEHPVRNSFPKVNKYLNA